MFYRAFLVALAVTSLALTHPVHENHSRDLKVIGRSYSALVRRQTPGSELQLLVDGNKIFRDTDPALLKKLTDEGQSPPFMFLGCSDSRVSEGTVFNAKPGTLFTQRNIANQFSRNDPNAESVLAYAVSELGVQHVIVMGHYGCGGVAAAIASRPSSNIDAASGVIQNWIEPIRELFQSSTRPEIVELRERINGTSNVEEPEVQEPGFRALVEENIKATVGRISQDSVITNHFALLGASVPKEKRAEHPLVNVFIHGWVYDIENGEIKDLNISVGPPGVAIPEVPFAKVAAAVDKTGPLGTPEVRCAEMCKSRMSKRSFVST